MEENSVSYLPYCGKNLYHTCKNASHTLCIHRIGPRDRSTTRVSVPQNAGNRWKQERSQHQNPERTEGRGATGDKVVTEGGKTEGVTVRKRERESDKVIGGQRSKGGEG